jgi:hypothetical protein
MSAVAAVPGPIPIPVPSVAVPAIPVRQILPWAVFVVLLGMIAMYFVTAEQGAFALFSGSGVHEWVHDGRHLLGFPCH